MQTPPHGILRERPEIEDLLVCPECRSPHLVRDDSRGEVVCDACGLVVSEGAIDPGPEWSAYNPEEGDRLARTGAPRGYTGQSMSLSTVIPIATKDGRGVPIPLRDREKYYRMRRLQRHSSHSRPGERSLPDVMASLDRVSSALGLPHALKEQTGFLCKKATEMGLLRGRKISSTVAAAVYASCRIGGVPRTLEEVQQATGVPRKEIAHSYGLLLRSLGLHVPPARAADYVSRFCSELDLGTDVERQAHRILKALDDGDRSLAVSPIGTTAAAIYLASVACGVRRPQKRIAEVAGVSEVTLRNRFRLVHEAWGLAPQTPRGRAPKAHVAR